MGNFVEFDHYAVAEDLDIASWDSYPLGFLDRDSGHSDELRRWYRTGHPDTSAFHHDLYRGVGKGRWWVMEQQPGPVNWAPHNPAPLAGMVRLWTWEAFAHGAEVVSYFRWRQNPKAQEQSHSALNLPNGQADTASTEVNQIYGELCTLQQVAKTQLTEAPVALLFDYTADQVQRITSSGGAQHDPLQHIQQIYRACRLCGINIDIVPISADLTNYRVVLIGNQIIEDEGLCKRLMTLNSTIVLFAGTGSRGHECAIPTSLAIGAFQNLINIKVTRSETLPAEIEMPANSPSQLFRVQHWRERVDSEIKPTAFFEDGWGFHYAFKNVHYLNAKLVPEDLHQFIKMRLVESGIAVVECAEGLRFRSLGEFTFAFNYGPEPITLSDEQLAGAELLMGKRTLAAAELALWRQS